MRTGCQLLAAAAIAAFVAGCGGSERPGSTGSGNTASAPTTVAGARAKLPPGATGPIDTAEEAAEGPAATEASPEAKAEGPAATGELSSADQAETRATVTRYIRALDRHATRTVCALLAPGALDLDELPVHRGSCAASLAGSIGRRPRGGGPAWRRTIPVELEASSLGDDRARVIATVTHHFSDRKYVSVEDDVIYLERVAGRWRLAKPSGTLYRAVGYAEPPLRAFSPPNGW
jgi:hypothetical protein